MRNNTRKNNMLKRYLHNIAFITVFISIFVTDDTLMFGTNSVTLFVNLKYIVIFGLLMLLMFQRSKQDISSISKLTAFMMCGLILLSAIINNDLRMGCLFKCVIILLAYFTTKRISLSAYTHYYVQIMYGISAISIVGMVLCTISMSLISFAPVLTNTADTAFYNLLVFATPVDADSLRNYGVFREPGVFQMFIILALIFHIYLSERINMKYFVVFTVALALTYSTTGYIAYGIFLIMYILHAKRKNISKKTTNRIIILALISGAILYAKTDILSSDGMVFGKFNQTERKTTIARMASFTSSYEIWKTSPIFGAGLEKTETKFKQITFRDYLWEGTNTNTIMSELATNGIIYTLLFLIGIILFIDKVGFKLGDKICFFVIILVLSAGEKLCFSPFFYTLLFYGWSLKRQANNFVEPKEMPINEVS